MISRRKFGGRVTLWLIGLSIVLVTVIDVMTIQMTDKLRRDQTGNATWVIAQVDTNLMELMLALAAPSLAADHSTADAVQRYDILYSRVMAVEALMKNPDFAAPTTLKEEWISIRDPLLELAVLFDNPGTLDQGNGIEILRKLDKLAQMTSRFSLHALHHIVAQSETSRVGLRTGLNLQIFMSLSVIAALLITAVGLNRMRLLVQRQTDKIAMQARELELVLAASTDPILVFDQFDIVSRTNPAVETVFGYSAEDIASTSFCRLFFAPEDADNVRKLVRSIRSTLSDYQPPTRWVFRGRTRDGKLFPVELQLASIRLHDRGRATVGFLRDISAEMQAKATLEAARDKAMHDDHEKTRFLAIISHELRTPLHGTLAALDLLAQSDTLSDAQRRLITLAQGCSNVSLDHVEQLLELSRADFGQQDSDKCSDVRPRDILANVQAALAPQSSRKGLEVIVEHEGTAIAELVRTNNRLLRHIFSNLLGNAIKYTERGQIRVRLTVDRDDRFGTDLRFEVSDTGIGISTEDLARIFNFMERGSSAHSSSDEGFGIGLYIVKRSAEALGGHLSASSVLGEGSRFVFRCRFQRATDTAVEHDTSSTCASIQDLARRRLEILVAEDNSVSQEVMKGLVEHLGHNVTIVPNGELAVAACQDKAFDAVLMDYNMPAMDGPEAARRILSLGPKGRPPVVIGVTAHVAANVKQRFIAAGATLTVTKPIGLQGLKDAIDRVARERPVSGSPTSLPKENDLVDAQRVTEMLEVLPSGRFQGFIERFESEGDQAIEKLGRCGTVAGMDPVRIVHDFSGACATMGAAALREILSKLESDLSAGSQIDPETLLEISSVWRMTTAKLRSLCINRDDISGGQSAAIAATMSGEPSSRNSLAI